MSSIPQVTIQPRSTLTAFREALSAGKSASRKMTLREANPDYYRVTDKFFSLFSEVKSAEQLSALLHRRQSRTDSHRLDGRIWSVDCTVYEYDVFDTGGGIAASVIAIIDNDGVQRLFAQVGEETVRINSTGMRTPYGEANLFTERQQLIRDMLTDHCRQKA